jgi:hypothetical protein
VTDERLKEILNIMTSSELCPVKAKLKSSYSKGCRVTEDGCQSCWALAILEELDGDPS